MVFIHGLWLLASSWDPWRWMFEAAGYATVAPDWPDDPATVTEGRSHPELFAGKSVGGITDHIAEVIKGLNVKPAIIGHSFGGLSLRKNWRARAWPACPYRSIQVHFEECCHFPSQRSRSRPR